MKLIRKSKKLSYKKNEIDILEQKAKISNLQRILWELDYY